MCLAFTLKVFNFINLYQHSAYTSLQLIVLFLYFSTAVCIPVVPYLPVKTIYYSVIVNSRFKF